MKCQGLFSGENRKALTSYCSGIYQSNVCLSVCPTVHALFPILDYLKTYLWILFVYILVLWISGLGSGCPFQKGLGVQESKQEVTKVVWQKLVENLPSLSSPLKVKSLGPVVQTEPCHVFLLENLTPTNPNITISKLS